MECWYGFDEAYTQD
jgi:hypothetical protein